MHKTFDIIVSEPMTQSQQGAYWLTTRVSKDSESNAAGGPQV